MSWNEQVQLKSKVSNKTAITTKNEWLNEFRNSMIKLMLDKIEYSG